MLNNLNNTLFHAKSLPDQIRITNTITVSSVDEFVKKIADNGGPLITQKIPIPELIDLHRH